eukprot:3600289-Heterocapsa_arctica.AAC.1
MATAPRIALLLPDDHHGSLQLGGLECKVIIQATQSTPQRSHLPDNVAKHATGVMQSFALIRGRDQRIPEEVCVIDMGPEHGCHIFS